MTQICSLFYFNLDVKRNTVSTFESWKVNFSFVFVKILTLGDCGARTAKMFYKKHTHPPPPKKKPHCMSTLLLGCPTIQEIRCFVLKKEKQSKTKRKYFRPLLKRNCPRNHFCMKNRFACESVFCSDFHFESDKINPLSRTVVVFHIPV